MISLRRPHQGTRNFLISLGKLVSRNTVPEGYGLLVLLFKILIFLVRSYGLTTTVGSAVGHATGTEEEPEA